jgi:hypothetical protein
MIARLFEIRDRGTFIPLLAVQCDPANEDERYLLAHAGFGKNAATQRRYVLCGEIDSGKFRMSYDPFDFPTGTLRQAVEHIQANFEALESGAVIDVEFLRGERRAPRQPERSLSARR